MIIPLVSLICIRIGYNCPSSPDQQIFQFILCLIQGTDRAETYKCGLLEELQRYTGWRRSAMMSTVRETSLISRSGRSLQDGSSIEIRQKSSTHTIKSNTTLEASVM